MVTTETLVSISRWRGVNPSTGERDTPRVSIVWRGKTLHSYGTEGEALRKIRESGWRLVSEGAL